MMKIITIIKNLINRIFFIFGYRVSKVNKSGELMKIYEYSNYEDYKNTQVFFNKKKIEKVWADEKTLKMLSEYIKKNIKSLKLKGLCHGSRNGFEQKCFLKEIPNLEIIGTDISETALNFENSIVHDFHDIKQEWIDYFDFVYSNSLDQSYNPKKALQVWLDQIKKDGFVIIEHSDQHGVAASGRMDPFGVETNFFPYVLSQWFGHKISINIINDIKQNKNNAPMCFFIIKKNY